MKAAKIFPLVLANVALLGTTTKMYWYDHLFPLWGAIVTVVVVGIFINTIVLVTLRRGLQKVGNRPGTK